MRSWSAAHGVPNAVMRLGNIYGPRQTPHGEAGVVAIFSYRLFAGEPCTLYGHGSPTRDYVHVLDVVSALRAASGRAGIYNVGTGVETDVSDALCAARRGRRIDRRAGPRRPAPGRAAALLPGRLARTPRAGLGAADRHRRRPRRHVRGAWSTASALPRDFQASLACGKVASATDLPQGLSDSHDGCHRRGRVPRLPPLRSIARPRPPRALRRQPRNRVADEYRAPARRALRVHPARSREPSRDHRADQPGAPFRQPGEPDRLPAPAAAHAQGGRLRHAQHARPGQGAPRALPARPRRARSTATRTSTRSPRATGATSTRSARAASTTRPSATPRP